MCLRKRKIYQSFTSTPAINKDKDVFHCSFKNCVYHNPANQWYAHICWVGALWLWRLHSKNINPHLLKSCAIWSLTTISELVPQIKLLRFEPQWQTVAVVRSRMVQIPGLWFCFQVRMRLDCFEFIASIKLPQYIWAKAASNKRGTCLHTLSDVVTISGTVACTMETCPYQEDVEEDLFYVTGAINMASNMVRLCACDSL